MNRHSRRAGWIAGCFLIAGGLPCLAQGDPAPQPTTQPAPSTQPSRYAHLASGADELPWTFDTIAQTIPSGTRPLTIDLKKTIPADVPVDQALATIFGLLQSDVDADHQTAYRVAGAISRNGKDERTIKLIVLMTHHGVGTKADPKAAVRACMPLVKSGNFDVCKYMASMNETLYAPAAQKIADAKALAHRVEPGAIKFSGRIDSIDRIKKGEREGAATNLVVDDGGEVPIDLAESKFIGNLKKGRIINVTGYLTADRRFVALFGEVPEPDVKWKHEVVRKGVAGGQWQVQTVRVTFSNVGIQTLGQVDFRVRCYQASNNINDYTSESSVKDLAPGQSRSVNVNFEMYNFLYIAASGPPSAEVSIIKTDW